MKRIVGVAHHLLERHPFCDSPINIVVCPIVIPPLSDAAYYTKKKSSAWARPRLSPVSSSRLLSFASPSSTILQPPHQPSFNRLPTTTHTLLARSSSHLPRQARTSSFLPSCAETPCNHAQTRKRRAGRSPPATLRIRLRHPPTLKLRRTS